MNKPLEALLTSLHIEILSHNAVQNIIRDATKINAPSALAAWAIRFETAHQKVSRLLFCIALIAIVVSLCACVGCVIFYTLSSSGPLSSGFYVGAIMSICSLLVSGYALHFYTTQVDGQIIPSWEKKDLKTYSPILSQYALDTIKRIEHESGDVFFTYQEFVGTHRTEWILEVILGNERYSIAHGYQANTVTVRQR